MLKKSNRLKSRRGFIATYNNNNFYKNEDIIAYVGHIKNDINCPTRVGFVVSKKVHKRAVVRNKIKRQMRESIRLLIKNNILFDRYQSLILIARNNIINKNYSQINNSILNLTAKVAKKNI